MKHYFQQVFQHELWANQQIFNGMLAIENPPERMLQIASHMVAAQITWLDRLTQTNSNVKVWEVFESADLLNLLELNHEKLRKFIENQEDFGQNVIYAKSKGEKFENTVQDILTQLSHHAAYHRGQIVILMKPLVEKLPITDYIFYIRR